MSGHAGTILPWYTMRAAAGSCQDSPARSMRLTGHSRRVRSRVIRDFLFRKRTGWLAAGPGQVALRATAPQKTGQHQRNGRRARSPWKKVTANERSSRASRNSGGTARAGPESSVCGDARERAGGGPIRCIPELLRHVERWSTRRYERVSIRKLQSLGTLTDLGARIGQRPFPEGEAEAPAGTVEVRAAAGGRPGDPPVRPPRTAQRWGAPASRSDVLVDRCSGERTTNGAPPRDRRGQAWKHTACALALLLAASFGRRPRRGVVAALTPARRTPRPARGRATRTPLSRCRRRRGRRP